MKIILAKDVEGLKDKVCWQSLERRNIIDEVLSLAKEVDELMIIRAFEKLRDEQFKAIVKTVNKKGLANTDWPDIEEEGGSFEFSDIAKFILKELLEVKQ